MSTGEARLAELVAALSLGVDLGFGQPMEHVLRETIIALRLAERLGLDDAERSTVYYAGLLVNVGCHADAHEQANWFGDDIALRSGKHDHDMRSAHAAAAAMRLVGSGNPPLHRFRVGLEFAIFGRRDLDGMIERHSFFAQALAERLGLPRSVQTSVASTYEQWDGRGWPGTLAGDDIPIAARLTQFAEFIEVAHRLGGVAAATALADRQAGSQFDPAVAAVLRDDPDTLLGDLDSAHTWTAVIDAEPTLRKTVSGAGFDEALLAIADFVDLKSPYTLGHARAVAELAGGDCRAPRMAGGRGAPAPARSARARSRTARRLERDLGQTPTARRRRVGTRPPAPVPHRTHAPSVRRAFAAGSHRRPASGEARRLRLPARARRRGDLSSRASARCGRCIPVDARAAAASAGAHRRRGGERFALKMRQTPHAARRRRPYARGMGLQKTLFAAMYDRMSRSSEDAGTRELRHGLLAETTGRVLEIGAGTGLNLTHSNGKIEAR